MIQYHFIIISKNKYSIKNFFIFFNYTLISFNIIKKYLKKIQKKKILTILKSPHVNKTAQEQFETKQFVSQITISYSPKNLQILIFLKKIKIYLFPDIKIKIKFTVDKSFIKKTQSKILNPDNYKLDFFNKQLKKNTKHYKNKHFSIKKKYILKQIEYFLKIFDIYGNLIRNMFR